MSAGNLEVLEFSELLSLIGGYLSSPLGKAKLAVVAPCADIQSITARQQRAAEAKEYLRSSMGGPRNPGERNAGSPASGGRTLPLDFSDLIDPAPALEPVAVEGTVLEIAEIQKLLSFAEKASDVKRALLASEGRFPHLAEDAAGIGDFHSMLHDLGRKILPSGELDDHASLELRRIRREIEKQRATILSSLKTFLREQPEDDAAQEEIVTIRGERFVVPVRVSRKRRVQGVVHGASSTGQTVYFEPLGTIDLNNELVRLKEEEQREIQRILAEMTAVVHRRAPELVETADRLGVLELAFGCGRFALDFDCIIPGIHGVNANSTPVRLLLKDARHPLLENLLRRKKLAVVPLSIVLEGNDRVLVISGPNTGGKTVALKTVGLLASMAMSGLPVPASEAEFPLFRQILADIGDYQSIQESLSTFSAHLLNISSMMSLADGDSLILLDELGSATDPEEAGALGVAVVDRFRSAGAFTIASTHHLLVKAYATNTAGVLSAHMGFDEQTLEPTYQLEMGSPGKSSGLAIARRLGVPADVLDHAAKSLSSEHHEVEHFLAALKEEQAAAVRLRSELQEKLADFDAREGQWKANMRRREQQRAAEWERQLEDLWHSFEERTEQKLREIASRAPAPARRPVDPHKEVARMASRLREQAKDELRQTLVSHVAEAGQGRPVSQPGVPREPAVGDRVRLKDLSQFGIVRRRDADWLEVEIGHLRTRVSLNEVVEVLPVPGPPVAKTGAAPGSFHVRMESPASGPLSEINVIGETAEEARSRVDKFLDNAFLSQLPRVRVVHGFGKGILRQTLAEMFATHPHVEKFFPAPQKEGGAGATIVELKV